MINCRFVDNIAYDNASYDAYIREAIGCELSFKGIDDLYWDINTTRFWGNTFPYASIISIRDDMYPNTTIAPFGGYHLMLSGGRILGMSANCDSAFTAGTIYVLPRIGDTLYDGGWSYSASMGFVSTGSKVGSWNYFSQTTDILTRFYPGDRLSVHVAANAAVPDTAALNVQLLVE